MNKERYNIKRTNSENTGFHELVKSLDKHLSDVFGTKQQYYNQFNIINDIAEVVVAYAAEIPIGCGCLKKFDATTVELKRMFVSDDYRGKGIAAKILNELEQWAKELGYKQIILETGTALNAANNFYKKQGYSITANWGQYIGVETSVCMKKIIND